MSGFEQSGRAVHCPCQRLPLAARWVSAAAALVLLGCGSGSTEELNGAPAAGGSATGVGGQPGTGGASFEAGGTAGDSGSGQGSGGASADDSDPSSGCGTEGTFSGESTHTIEVNGGSRTYIVRVPDDYDPNTPYRLMVSMHPRYGSAEGVASGLPGTNYEYYGIWSRDDDKTIFLSPQGLGDPTGWANGGGSDESFIMAVIEKLESEMCIDSSRIFAMGFSFGGSMAYALACRFPERFRAVAMHSGGPMSGCNQDNRGPVAFFMTHAIDDEVTTYPDFGVPQLNDFAARNGCDSLDVPTPTDPSGNTPVCVDFQNCASDFPTRACLFEGGGGHTPSPPNEATTWVPGETWTFISQF